MSVMVLAENEEEAKTQVANAHGGMMIMRAHLHMGQSFLLKNPQPGSEMSCCVVRVDESGDEDWPITFPPVDWGLPS